MAETTKLEVDLSREKETVKTLIKDQLKDVFTRLKTTADGLVSIEYDEAESKVVVISVDAGHAVIAQGVIVRLVRKEKVILDKEGRLERSSEVLKQRQVDNHFYQDIIYVSEGNVNSLLSGSDEKLKEIKECTNTTIFIRIESGKIKVRGDTKESVEKAILMIRDCIPDKKIVEIDLPPHLTGYFIGSHGNNINAIRSSIPKVYVYLTDHGKIQLIGMPEDIPPAQSVVEMELEKLNELYELDKKTEILNDNFQDLRFYRRKQNVQNAPPRHAGGPAVRDTAAAPRAPAISGPARPAADNPVVVQPIPHMPHRELHLPLNPIPVSDSRSSVAPPAPEERSNLALPAPAEEVPAPVQVSALVASAPDAPIPSAPPAPPPASDLAPSSVVGTTAAKPVAKPKAISGRTVSSSSQASSLKPKKGELDWLTRMP